MSNSITSRTIVTLDKKLALNNSQWAATLDIGDNWTKIRIGCRFCVTDTTANITTARRYIGLMSNPVAGLTNGPMVAGTSHYIGLGAAAVTMTRATTPVLHYSGLSHNPFKKVGAVTTAIGGGTTGFCPIISTDIRVGLILEIIKGSPWSFDWSGPTGTAALVDLPLEALKAAMVHPSTVSNINGVLNAAIGGSGTRYADASGATPTIVVDEGTDGPLNAVCVAWDRSVDFEYSEVLFAKMA